MDELLQELALLKDRIYDLELRHARHKHLGDVDQTQKAIGIAANYSSIDFSVFRPLQFSNNGILDGTQIGYTFFPSDTSPIMELTVADAPVANSGGGVWIITGSNGNGSGDGQSIGIYGGRNDTGSSGGALGAGGGYANGNGGRADLEGGSARGATAIGGDVYIVSGSNADHPTGDFEGEVYLVAGNNQLTTRNHGFVHLQSVGAGAPTGTPIANFALYYDTTNNDLYFYNSAWKKVHLA